MHVACSLFVDKRKTKQLEEFKKEESAVALRNWKQIVWTVQRMFLFM